MSFEKALRKLPESLQATLEPFVLVLMEKTGDEIAAWIDLLLNGKTPEAWYWVYSEMNQTVAWDELKDLWKEANAEQVESLMVQKNAINQILTTLLALIFGVAREAINAESEGYVN